MRALRVMVPAVLLALAAAPVAAQVAPKLDSARVAAAQRLLVASGAAETMVTMFKAALPAQRANMPEVPAAFWDQAERRMERDRGMLVDSIAVLYASMFTEVELNALTAFYESAIGRRFRGQQGELMAQSSAIGQRWGERIGREVAASMQP